MPKVDGLEMLVRFYYNHDRLFQVALRSDVPLQALREWMVHKTELSQEHRQMLLDSMQKNHGEEVDDE